MNKCKTDQLKGGEKEMENDVSLNFLGEESTYKKGGSKMKMKFEKLMKNEKGMTLIELLAVIVIIAIIALIAIPAIGSIINNSKDKALLADASTIINGAKIAFSDGACESATTCSGAVLKDYVDGSKVSIKDTDSVTKNGTVYTLNYEALKTNKGTKYAVTSGSIDSDKLAVLMGNK